MLLPSYGRFIVTVPVVFDERQTTFIGQELPPALMVQEFESIEPEGEAEGEQMVPFHIFPNSQTVYTVA